MEENVHSDLFLAVEDGDLDKVVEIITSRGISPTVKNKVQVGSRDSRSRPIKTVPGPLAIW